MDERETIADTDHFRQRESHWQLARFALLGIILVAVIFGVIFFARLKTQGSVATFLHADTTRPSLGPANAPLLIVEYSDFQCPFCKQEVPVLQQVVAEYGDKVRIEYRHYPIYQIHPRAVIAGVASECAHVQGRFWDYHDLIFENQKNLSDADLLVYARRLGLNQEQFAQCMKSPPPQKRVTNDYNEARAAGVRATPTFFINGKFVEGAIAIEQWRDILNNF